MNEHLIRMHMESQGADPEDIEAAVDAFTDDRLQMDKDARMEMAQAATAR